MLYIDDNLSPIKKARDEHYKIVSGYLKSYHKKGTEITDFIHDNLNDLIIGKPDVLMNTNDKFYNSLTDFSSIDYRDYFDVIKPIKEVARTPQQQQKAVEYETLHNSINKIINYEDWFIKSAKLYDYQLTINLNRNSCTYCNRNYTHTIKKDDKDRMMRPQLDHWYPKSKYPLLALSFYNLIPSCVICNSSIKSADDFNIASHIHPYLDDIVNDFSFKYNYDRSLKKYKITIDTSDSRILKTFTDMQVADIYNAHQLELRDLIKTKNAYSKNYLKSLKNAFPKANLKDNEIYRLAFGVEIEKENFHTRPLSKFKSDILKDLGIIDK